MWVVHILKGYEARYLTVVGMRAGVYGFPDQDQEKEFLNLDQEIKKLEHFEQMATISCNRDNDNNN